MVDIRTVDDGTPVGHPLGTPVGSGVGGMEMTVGTGDTEGAGDGISDGSLLGHDVGYAEMVGAAVVGAKVGKNVSVMLIFPGQLKPSLFPELSDSVRQTIVAFDAVHSSWVDVSVPVLKHSAGITRGRVSSNMPQPSFAAKKTRARLPGMGYEKALPKSE